jgi:hypothetical protein
MVNDDARDLTDRYVAIWNEPDAARRRNAVNALRTSDALHLLQPPEAVREAAAAPLNAGEAPAARYERHEP